MKKFVTLALVLILAFASVAALALETGYSSKDMQVTLTLEGGYEWTVPESLTLYEFPTDELKNEFDVEVTKWLRIPEDKQLYIWTEPESSITFNPLEGDGIEVSFFVKGTDKTECYFEGTGKETYSFIINGDISTRSAGDYTNKMDFKANLIDKRPW